MKLSKFDEKHVRVSDIYGGTHTGAAENIGSRKVLEKAGMRLVRTEKDGLAVGDRIYDKRIYEYTGEG